MKVAVLVLVIIGCILMTVVGISWLSDYNDNKSAVDSLNDLAKNLGVDDSTSSGIMDQVNNIAGYESKGYILIICGVVALAAFLFKKKLGAMLTSIVILAAGILPIIASPKALIFSSVLILAGILSFVVKNQDIQAPPTQAAQ
ncbi:MAG: hypothetical protein Q8920_00055 [Bacillota bacterium]|nr:hypothetical protein [Bacillota bacterium]